MRQSIRKTSLNSSRPSNTHHPATTIPSNPPPNNKPCSPPASPVTFSAASNSSAPSPHLPRRLGSPQKTKLPSSVSNVLPPRQHSPSKFSTQIYDAARRPSLRVIRTRRRARLVGQKMTRCDMVIIAITDVLRISKVVGS